MLSYILVSYIPLNLYIGTYFYPYFVMEANLVKYVLKWFSGVRKEDYSIFLNTHNKSTNVCFPPPLPRVRH